MICSMAIPVKRQAGGIAIPPPIGGVPTEGYAIVKREVITTIITNYPGEDVVSPTTTDETSEGDDRKLSFFHIKI